jgi:hypothetical protein
MNPVFEPRSAPASFYDEQIKRLAVRLQEEMGAASKTEQELRWWQEGRRIFGDEGGAEESADGRDQLGVASETNEITPAAIVFETGAKPTIRQAIMRVLLDSSEPALRASAITDQIEQLRWAPDGKFWKNSIRNKLGDLVKAGELVKVDVGVYALSDAVRAREGLPTGPEHSPVRPASSPPRGAVSQNVLEIIRAHGPERLRPAQVGQLLELRGVHADSNAIRVALRRWTDRGHVIKWDDGTYSNGFSDDAPVNIAPNGHSLPEPIRTPDG